MEPNVKTCAELAAEAEQAHWEAELTVELGKQLLERAHEVADDIRARVCQVVGNEALPSA
jgi:hypothetical protein